MVEALPVQLAFELSAHEGPVRAVRFNRIGRYCLTSGSDKTVRLWNPHRGLLIKTYGGHGDEVLDADASHDNSRLCSGGADKTVQLTDVGTGQPIRKYRGHISRVNSVKFNDDSTVIVSGSYDSSVRAWDCRSRSYDPIQVLGDAKDSVTSVQLAPSEILTGSVDGSVRRYDLRFGKLHCDTIANPVTCVSFSRDGNCILASCLDNTLRLMDKDTGEMLNSYKGHKNQDYKLDSCLSHDDAHVVSGSEDGTVCFWDLVEGNLLHSFPHVPPHKSASRGQTTEGDGGGSSRCVVYSLAHHPKESCLLTAASHGPVRVWKKVGWETEEEEEEKDEETT
ncbi:WD repeat domain-containing protein 83 [Geodia barretti]|jgi:mitogen-activated protein kinase organizer 1|uniref:WD repeat domain-containing protein 83 n=1 Tax=Geodia barretti TaxID=519541 RepID=A0AA35X6D5_GEOBA|nr:WD repeat domain-containing protein 83 [Geodia barretti]